METSQISPLDKCYIMQREDIARFADTLADGFSKYHLFRHICNGEYSHKKMSVFWAVSIAILHKGAICIADSKDVNSVLVYVPPQCKEPGIMDYLKAGGLKMLITLGLRSTFRLLEFDMQAQKVAAKYKRENCGYLMAFATRLNRQGQHYGKPLMEALLHYLDMTGESCYLETLKGENVGLYRHFSFELMEQVPLKSDGLTLYAMYRSGKEK